MTTDYQQILIEARTREFKARERSKVERARRIKRAEKGKTCDRCGERTLNLGTHQASFKCIAATRAIQLEQEGWVRWKLERKQNERLWQVAHQAGVLRFEPTGHQKGWGNTEHKRARIVAQPWVPQWVHDLIHKLAYQRDRREVNPLTFAEEEFRYTRADFVKILRAARSEHARHFIMADPDNALVMLKNMS